MFNGVRFVISPGEADLLGVAGLGRARGWGNTTALVDADAVACATRARGVSAAWHIALGGRADNTSTVAGLNAVTAEALSTQF